MTNSQIKQLFKEVFNGNKNIITPNVLKYGTRGLFAFEISYGDGFDGETIYGVTLINKETRKHNHELSRSFNTRGEVTDYLADVIKHIKAA